jgi:signal transduction histidine kinase
LTPEAVIDRYLETASREPFDAADLALLLGTDADLLSRWLSVLGCPAEPDAFIDAVSGLPPERFHDLAMSQALAVLSVPGSLRLSFDQWQSVLVNSLVAELLATELGLSDPVAVRWRVLLAASGVNLAQDPLLMELLAYRGARRDLLEDASPIHRLFAVVESLDVSDPLASQEAAAELLDLDLERHQGLVSAAEARCGELLERLGLRPDGEGEAAERLWLRLQLAALERLLPSRTAPADALSSAHELACRRLFSRRPELFLLDEAVARLVRIGGGGPDIAFDSRSSSIARSARLGERLQLFERADEAVADRQVLRRLESAEAVCLPLRAATGETLGVVVYAVDEDVDQELAMELYAEALARRLARPLREAAPRDDLARYRQRAEKRLRELVHEANNPLSIVNNYLHILELRLAHEPEAVEQLRLIAAELKRAGAIVSQARELPAALQAETEAEPEPAEPRPGFGELDLNQLARNAVELHLGLAGEYRVSLSESLVPGSLMIRSDEHRLMQILNNLVRNAIEASHGATVSVSTVSGVFREGREGVLLGVADTGPGLPREVLERLSDPKQSTKGDEHAGLGLHIVHRLVAELGGSIDVRTAPGQGTAFSIFLPLGPAP